MTNDEKSILLPQIEELIAKYELGARKAINTSDTKQIESFALSLQISPMRTMRFAMNAMDSASLTPEEIENEYKVQNGQEINKEITTPTKEKVFEANFLNQNIDCEIVGGDKWYDKEKVVGEDVNFAGEKIPSKVGYKLTNPIKTTLNLSPLFVGGLDEPRSGKKVADCFDCPVKFTAEFMYPSIEVMWEFEKLLKGLLDAIKIIKQNLNPASLYADICNLKAFVGTNFLCPSMMLKINLMLPTLFMKYSMDLGKISIDANFVLGGLLKIAISAIATFLENIRALIVPFVDCAINAAKSVSGYVKSVASAISKGIDEVASLGDKVAQIAHKTGIMLGEVFSKDPTGLFEDAEKISKEIKDIKAQQKKTEEEINKILNKLSGNSTSTDVERIKKYNDLINLSMWLLECLPEEYGGKYNGNYKSNPLIVEVKKFYEDSDLNEGNFWELDENQFKGVLSMYLLFEGFEFDDFKIKNLEEESRESFAYSNLVEKEFDELSGLETKYNSLEEDINSKSKELKNKIKEIHSENKDSLNYKMYMRDKKFTDMENYFMKEVPGGNKNTLIDFLKTRYSFNLQNSYVNHEYMATKSFKAGAKKITSDPLNQIAKLIDNYIIRYLEYIKKNINDFFGNIINSLKNLNIILEQNAFTQFKIIGEIMQLVHVIRAFKLIYKLISEGFEGCDKLSKSKEQEQILKKAMEEITEEQLTTEVISKENDSGTQEEFLRIYSKKGNYNYNVSLKDCADSSDQLKNANPDLDYMYSMMQKELL